MPERESCRKRKEIMDRWIVAVLRGAICAVVLFRGYRSTLEAIEVRWNGNPSILPYRIYIVFLSFFLSTITSTTIYLYTFSLC